MKKAMKKTISLLMIVLLLAVLAAGCAPKENTGENAAEVLVEQSAAASPETPADAPPAAEEDALTVDSGQGQAEAPTAEVPAEIPAEIPAAPIEPITLNEQVYVSPSNAFTVNLPKNWNCSESGQYRVDCHNADNTAAVILRVIGTGYELTQESFQALAQAELVNRYADVRAYIELARDLEVGSVVNQATWQEGDVPWRGIDRFVRSGPAVYYLTFASTQERFDTYQPAFEEIFQKTKLTSSAMSGAPLYAFRKEFVSREKIFKIQVPTSWSKFADASLDRTVVEGFTSPDGRAGVQVAIFAKGSNISQETKGVKTLEIMHDLYGWDMRVLTDKALPDGREWLTWYGERKGIYGSTYFDSVGTYLYIFSVIWEESTKSLYKPVLDEVVASFAYVQ